MTSQNDEVLDYIRAHGSITQYEAAMALGVMRLAARIADLKARGVKLRAEREFNKNRNGKKVWYCRYYLVA